MSLPELFEDEWETPAAIVVPEAYWLSMCAVLNQRTSPSVCKDKASIKV